MTKVLLPLVLFMYSLAALAETDVFDLAAKYNKISKGLTHLETHKRKVLADIYDVEKKTNKLVLQKNEIDEKKLSLDGELSRLSVRIVQVEREIEGLLPELVDRLNFADHVNNLPWFYTFLTSQSLADLEVTISTAEHINSEESESVVQLANLINQLEQSKRDLSLVAYEIVLAQKNLKVKESEIEKVQLAKKAYLKKLEDRLKGKKISLKKVKEQGHQALSKADLMDMDMLFGSRFFDKKGKLPHPIEAGVTHEYGLNKGLLQDRVQLIHKGLFYRTEKPQQVRSVAQGRVKFSEKVPGLGGVIIIDHGSRYYTTYSNLAEVTIKKNKEVKKGTALGLTGFDHMQMGTGAYFEIRHFSQPQNPELWLKKSKEQIATL